MPKLSKLLKKNKMTLIVDLPENDPGLAEVAIEEGADVLQLHISMQGVGAFEQEKENLSAILHNSKVPIGLAVGRQNHLSKKEIDQITKMGFDFFNIGIEHLTPPILGAKGISRILTLNSRYTLDEVVEVSQSKFEALDAAVVPASDRGKELQVGDLQRYISVILSSGIPVIIPTQRDLHSSEVAIIADTGAKGILLTKVVTGSTLKHVGEATRKFKGAIDDLSE